MLNTNQNLSGDNRGKVSTFLHSEVLTAFWSFPSYLDKLLKLEPEVCLYDTTLYIESNETLQGFSCPI